MIVVRVIQATAFGGPDVLKVAEVPDRTAGPGEVVVHVTVAGVLSVDAMIRRGLGGEHFPVRPPYVPGVGVAGRVGSVGAGVDRDWIGRRVLADIEHGGYAERVLAPADALIPIPDSLGPREAMALLHDGSTALGLFEAAGVRRRETVFIQPAGGGLGSLLVQLARAAGAYVIGGARGPRKLALVKELGGRTVVDYSDAGWADGIRAEFGGVDVVFDGIGGDQGRAAFELVNRGGRFSGYGLAGGAPTEIDPGEAQRRGVRAAGMERLPGFAADRKRLAGQVLRDAAAGRLRPVIGQTYPLERAAEAHAAIESRSFVGKTLLLV